MLSVFETSKLLAPRLLVVVCVCNPPLVSPAGLGAAPGPSLCAGRKLCTRDPPAVDRLLLASWATPSTSSSMVAAVAVTAPAAPGFGFCPTIFVSPARNLRSIAGG